MTRYRFFILTSILSLVLVRASLAQDLVTLVKRIQPAVVTISVYDSANNPLQSGSGFFINQGLLVTNRHVLAGASRAEVRTAEGKTYAVSVLVADDKAGDLVEVQTDIPQALAHALPLSNAVPQAGERVVVIGSPLGLEQTVSEGIVSAVRDFPGRGKMVQITAPVSPGSSGSPVVNLKGEVIGIATLMGKEGQNLNFAVPAGRVSALSPEKGRTLAQWTAGATRERSATASATPPESQTDKTEGSFRWWQVGVPGHPVPTEDIKGPVRKLIRGELKIVNKFGKWEEEAQVPWLVITRNIQGAVTEGLHFFWKFNSPHPCTHHVYTYDAQGHQVQNLWYEPEGKTAQQLCLSMQGYPPDEQHCYDARGHPIDIEKICRHSETLLYKTVYKYDTQGNLVEEVLYNSGQSVNRKTTHAYDPRGKLIADTYYNADGSVSWLGKNVYSYDSEGKLTAKRSYDGDGSPRGQTLYTYDDRRNRIEKVTKYTDESPEERTVYAYDEAGRGRLETGYKSGSLSFQETYDEAGHRIKSVEGGTTTLYSYNDKGETVAEEAYGQDGTLVRKEVTRWEHDHMGNPIKYIRSRWVTKFGEPYFEPSFGEYFVTTYHGKEEK